MAEAEAAAPQPRDAAAGIYTETLARLYLKQGFVERALAIYRRLAQEQPDNAQLHERLHTLEQELARGGPGPEPVVQRGVSDAADETTAPMIHRHEYHIAAQLGRWLHYLQRQRRQREQT
jgi:hypothetical protein